MELGFCVRLNVEMCVRLFDVQNFILVVYFYACPHRGQEMCAMFFGCKQKSLHTNSLSHFVSLK